MYTCVRPAPLTFMLQLHRDSHVLKPATYIRATTHVPMQAHTLTQTHTHTSCRHVCPLPSPSLSPSPCPSPPQVCYIDFGNCEEVPIDCIVPKPVCIDVPVKSVCLQVTQTVSAACSTDVGLSIFLSAYTHTRHMHSLQPRHAYSTMSCHHDHI